jgi:hypothetical protein
VEPLAVALRHPRAPIWVGRTPSSIAERGQGGDGAGQLEHEVEGTGGELELGHGGPDEGIAGVVELAILAHVGRAMVTILSSSRWRSTSSVFWANSGSSSNDEWQNPDTPTAEFGGAAISDDQHGECGLVCTKLILYQRQTSEVGATKRPQHFKLAVPACVS